MTDDADRAEEEIERELERALEEARCNVPTPGEGSETCVVCGAELQPARAAAGYSRCMDCAQAAERFTRTHSRR